MHGLEYSVSMSVEAESSAKLLKALSKYAIDLGLEGASPKTDQLKNAHTLVSCLQTIGKATAQILRIISPYNNLKEERQPLVAGVR